MTENATVRLDVLSDADFDVVEKAFDDLEKVIATVKESVVNTIKNVQVNLENLEDNQKSAQNAINSAPESITSKGQETLLAPMKGIWRAVRGLTRTVGMVAGIIGSGLGTVVGILSMFYVLQQPLKMIGDLTKMIAALLRPITDMMVMLIMPVFHMLRPIVQMVNTMMMPFREAAFTGLAAANQLIAEGTQMILGGDTDVGSDMVGEGLQGAMSSASLMFSGFFEMIGQPIAEMLGMGERFSNAMKNWQDSSLEGIHRVIMLNDTFQGLKPTFESVTDAARDSLAVIDNQVALLRQIVGTFTLDNFKQDLQTAQTIAEGSVALLIGDVETLENKIQELDLGIGEFSGAITAGAELTESSMKGLADAVNQMTAVQIEAARRQAERTIQDVREDGPGLLERTKGGLGAVRDKWWEDGNLMGWTHAFREGSEKVTQDWMKDTEYMIEKSNEFWNNLMPESMKGGLDHMHRDMKEYMEYSIIPDAFESGLVHMSNYTNTHMSSISSTHNSSLSTMQSATNNFGSAVNRVAGIVQDAVRRMEQYARAYHSALARINSLERQLRDRRND
jgi:hypothetical protein